MQSQGGKTAEEIRAAAEEAGASYNKAISELVDKQDIKSARKDRRDASKQELFDKEGRVLPGGGIQQEKQGSLALAMSDAQGAIFDAYKDALLELVGIDYLFDQLNKLPGAKLVAEFI